MSTSAPRNLSEWADAIAAMPAEGLTRKARAINSIDFVDQLLADGLTAAEVESVYVLLAKRMKQLAVVMPDGGLYDWREMATRAVPITPTVNDKKPAKTVTVNEADGEEGADDADDLEELLRE